MARLKLNEIKKLIKSGEFNKEGQFKVQGSFSRRVAEEGFLQRNILQWL